MDLQKLMQQAQKMQSQLDKVGKELNQTEYTGTAGGDGVKVVVNGAYTVSSVEIENDLLDAENKEMLQDLIVVAFNNAITKINDDKNEKMKPITGGMNLPGIF